MKSVISLLLTALCLLLISFNTTSCSFGCRGTDGEYEPPVYEIVLNHPLHSSQTKGKIISFESRSDIDRLFSGFQPTKRNFFSLDQTGERVFIRSNYFDSETRSQRIGLAASDSLSFCSFTRLSDDALCVVTRPDTLRNPITARDIPVDIAHTNISLWEDIRGAPLVLRKDTAFFISEDDYQVTKPVHPVMSNDNSRLAYIQEIEVRRIIRNGEGEIMREAVISKQRDLVLQNMTTNEPPEVLVENVTLDNLTQHYVAISPDGNQIALAQDNGVIQLINIPDNSTTQLEGLQYPEFTSSSRFLVANTFPTNTPAGLRIYNLENVTLQDTLTHVHGYYNVDASRDLIFYYSSRTTTNDDDGLKMYDIEEGTNTLLLTNDDLGDYERNISNGSRTAYLISRLYIGVDNNGLLHLFGQIDFNRVDDC